MGGPSSSIVTEDIPMSGSSTRGKKHGVDVVTSGRGDADAKGEEDR